MTQFAAAMVSLMAMHALLGAAMFLSIPKVNASNLKRIAQSVLAYISPIIGVVILAALPLIALVNEFKGLKLIEETGIILIVEGAN